MKLKITTVIALVTMLFLSGSPSAHGYRATELFPNGSQPCIEAVTGNYVQRSLPQWSYGGLTAGVNANDTTQIVIFGMFEGMLNAAFNITESNGKTYATLATNSSGYLYTYALQNSSLCVNRQIRTQADDDAFGVALFPLSMNNYGNYSTTTQWTGEVKKTDDGVWIVFTTPIGMRYTDSDHYFFSNGYEGIFNTYELLTYSPNASTADTYYLLNDNTFDKTDRQYSTSIVFTDYDNFTITNWGNFGNGVSIVQNARQSPNVNCAYYQMQGYIDRAKGKVYMKRAPWIQDIVNVTASTADVYSTIRKYELRPIENAAQRSGIVTFQDDVNGTIEFGVPQHVEENDLWAAPYGNLRTLADAELCFEPFAAYDVTNSTILNFRIDNTRIKVPQQDVTLAIQPVKTTFTPNACDPATPQLCPVDAEVVFTVRNDMFADSYDVYLIEGTDPKGEKSIYMGNLKKSDKDAEGYHTVTGRFELPSPDGKPWSDHFQETFSFPYHIKVVAHYADNTSEAGMKMAGSVLADSYHGLSQGTVDITVGVAMLGADDMQLEQTRDGITVKAPENMPVEVINMSGITIARGHTNVPLPIDARGIFLVKAGNRVFRIVR